MFALCTYIDRERWASGFEPLLYPTGVTFYRPFSYRSQYFHPEQLADQLADPAQCKSLLSQAAWNDGFFGIRFRDESAPSFLPLFVPLRKLTIVGVEVVDNINITFRLGSYVVPQYPEGGGVRVLPRLDLSDILPDATETKLFIHFRDAERQPLRDGLSAPDSLRIYGKRSRVLFLLRRWRKSGTWYCSDSEGSISGARPMHSLPNKSTQCIICGDTASTRKRPMTFC